MNTNNYTAQLPIQDSFQEGVFPIHDESNETDFIMNLFDEEGAFGEGDCAGL